MSKVSFAAAAITDLRRIWRTIALHDEAIADRILAEIEAKCARLGQFPYLGRERPELKAGWRSLAREPYVIFYALTGDESVRIYRVLDGRRDLQTVLGAGMENLD